MDPFSIAAGTFGILAALVQCSGKTCELIDSWKDAPKDFRQLQEECKALKAVLMDVMEAQNLKNLPPIDAIDSPKPVAPRSPALQDHVKKAEGVLSTLRSVTDGLAARNSTGEIKVKRVKFMGEHKKIKNLKREISSLNQSLGTLLVVRILSNVHQLRVELRHSDVALLSQHQTGRSYSGATLVTTPLPRQLPIQSTGIATQDASTTHISSESDVESTDTATSSVRCNGPLKKVSGLVELAVSCQSCKCRCHQQRSFSTPDIFTAIFGRAVITISGQVTSPPECTIGKCPDASTLTITLTYYFPSWWTARAVVLRCIRKPLGDPSWALKVRDLLPEHSPMLTAITNGDLAQLRSITDPSSGLRQCSPDAMEVCGWTGLTWAIHMNQTGALQFLLEAKADPRLEDGFGRSAVDFAWIAIFEKQVLPTTATFLREHLLTEANDELDDYSLTALHRVVLGVLEGSVEATVQDMPPSLINATDGFGKTALLWASRRGDLESVKCLLRHGANPNLSDHMRRSPLHMAARSRNVEVIHELIRFDADPLADNFISEKPAHYAAYEPNGVDLLQPFFEHGMDVEQPSKFGRTLLDIAVQWNYPATVRYLIDRGADRNGSNKSSIRDTPLGRAILYGLRDVMKLLLGLVVDVNHVDGHSSTYLHLLALEANANTLESFCDISFASWLPDVLDEKQKTPLDVAEEHAIMDGYSLESFRRFLEQIKVK